MNIINKIKNSLISNTKNVSVNVEVLAYMIDLIENNLTKTPELLALNTLKVLPLDQQKEPSLVLYKRLEAILCPKHYSKQELKEKLQNHFSLNVLRSTIFTVLLSTEEQEIRKLELHTERLTKKIVRVLSYKQLTKWLAEKTADNVLHGLMVNTDGSLDFSQAEKHFFKLPGPWLKLVQKILIELNNSLAALAIEVGVSGDLKEDGLSLFSPAAKEFFVVLGINNFQNKDFLKDIPTILSSKNREEIPVSLSGAILEKQQEDVQNIVIVMKDLRKIKEYARNRLSEITPILNQVAHGDFSQKINIAEEKDEFTEHLLVINQMINDFQKMMEEIKTKGKELNIQKEVDRMKTEFVSVASHQLRTPLTGINWYIEMLLSGDVGEITGRQREYLEEVYEGGQRMVKLVNELLNVSRLETGRLKIEPTLVQIEDFIQKIIDEIRPLTLAKKCGCLLQTPKIKLPKIMVDQELLRQVIHNLLTNAAKYSPPEKCDILTRVEIKNGAIPEFYNQAPLEGEFVLISVVDKGIGIPENVQSRIFNKFFRADNAIRLATDGSGLGLYIAKMIIEASGGRIWFKSQSDVGSTFYVALPINGMQKRIGTKVLSPAVNTYFKKIPGKKSINN